MVALELKYVVIIGIYAPTNSATEEIRSTFYTNLTAYAGELRSQAQNKVLVIAGHFNAQIEGQGHWQTNQNGKLAQHMMTELDLTLIKQEAATFHRSDREASTIDHFVASEGLY